MLRDFSKNQVGDWISDVVVRLDQRDLLFSKTTLVIHTGKDNYEEVMEIPKRHGSE